MPLTRHWGLLTLALAAGLLLSRQARAHCDTTSGPVVTAARAALEAGDANLVLHWVRPEDEAAVRSAFQQTLAVRALGPEARTLADRSFFETLVRLHRAGEGAPYTGLSDEDPEPIIAATDRALAAGSSAELEDELVRAVRAGLAERFSAARAASSFRPGDVAAGRAYVAAYVPLTHWVEGVLTAAEGHGGEHHAAGEATHGAVPQAPDHEEPTAPGERPGALPQLPWLLVGVLGVAALVEGALLVRRRRPAAA